MVAIEEALEIIELWLNTPFEGGRHQARIDTLDRIEA
jgi:ribose 5-phosphate isomerase B